MLAFEQKQVQEQDFRQSGSLDDVAFVAGVRSDGQAETPARVHEEHVRRHLGVPEENILAAKEARKTAEASAMLKRTDAPEAERPERERQYINVPYKEKDEAKGLGARWDRQQQSWYLAKGVEAAPFAKWAHGAATAAEAPGEAQNPAQQARQSRLLPGGALRTAPRRQGRRRALG